MKTIPVAVLFVAVGGGIGVGSPAAEAAEEYHVSTKGNDQADGSQARPWATIGHAAAALQPGDTLIIAAGTYREPLTVSGLKGTAEQPIVIRGEEKARVLLDLAGQRTQGIEVEACAHVVLRGFEVAGGESSGIVLHDCHNCTIEGNVVNSFKAVGIRLRASNDNTVRGNICYHNDSGIYVGEGSTRNLIEANICALGNQSSENADGIGSSDCADNIYRFNVLIANNDDGIDMWTSKRNTIEWNLACANGDQRNGDGNGFKLGGKWNNRKADDPWDGGGHIVRNNLSVWNQSTGFTDNGSSGNQYEANVAFGNRNTGSYASVKHSVPTEAEPIREKIRQRFQVLIEEGVIQPTIHRLPLAVGLIYELKIWPAVGHAEQKH